MLENLYVGMLCTLVALCASFPRGKLQAMLHLAHMKEEPDSPRVLWAAAILDVVMGLCVAYVLWAVAFTLLAGHPNPLAGEPAPRPEGVLVPGCHYFGKCG